MPTGIGGQVDEFGCEQGAGHGQRFELTPSRFIGRHNGAEYLSSLTLWARNAAG